MKSWLSTARTNHFPIPVQIEDLLDDNEPTQQRGELHADDCNDRQHRVLQRVAANDDGPEETFRLCRAHVVFVQDLKQSRARVQRVSDAENR